MNESYPEISQQRLELQTWGVPVELQFVKNMDAANRGLSLTQTGNDPDNSLFTTKSGRVALLTSLAITNISDHDIKVYDIRVALPFDATDFHWIQPPAGATNHQYELPALGECPFEGSVILNSRLGRKFLIHSGLSVEGLLLGEAQVAWPGHSGTDPPCRSSLPYSPTKAGATRSSSFFVWSDTIKNASQRICCRAGALSNRMNMMHLMNVMYVQCWLKNEASPSHECQL
jgi:hypothetical protein